MATDQDRTGWCGWDAGGLISMRRSIEQNMLFDGSWASSNEWKTPVPLYHFNVLDGVSDIDTEGTELPDTDTALREARSLASSIIKDAREWDNLGEEWRIEVTDHAGTILFRIDVAEMRSPLMRVEKR